MNYPILAPAAVLVVWSLLVLLWLATTRFSAMAKSGMDLKTAPPGGRGVDLETVLPAKTNWISHNYTHLLEQPTLFYATVGILAISGHGDGINAQLAWAYVIIRIVHSLWQALINTVAIRFTLFLISTGCLLAMAINALRATTGI